MTENSVIVGSLRTAVAPRHGALATYQMHEMAAPVVQTLLKQKGIPIDQVDEIIVGNALGAGGNPARLIGLAAGISEQVAGLTIDRQCCSGLDAILLADNMIRSGSASVVIAGGVESYSQRPVRLRKLADQDELQPYDHPPFTPWPDRDPEMAVAANTLAQLNRISFERQNSWAIHSHEKALVAQERMKNEIVPIGSVKTDSFTRALSVGLCSRATRVHGDITSANMAVAADAAAFSLVVSESIARNLRSKKLIVRAGATVGANPELPGLAPVDAIRLVLQKANVNATQIQRAEIMEAFAVQAMACIELVGLHETVCNCGGGALARGHPVGASGAVLTTRLFSEMKSVQGFGIAAIAAAGGLGTAMLVEHAD